MSKNFNLILHPCETDNPQFHTSENFHSTLNIFWRIFSNIFSFWGHRSTGRETSEMNRNSNSLKILFVSNNKLGIWMEKFLEFCASEWWWNNTISIENSTFNLKEKILVMNFYRFFSSHSCQNSSLIKIKKIPGKPFNQLLNIKKNDRHIKNSQRKFKLNFDKKRREEEK